MGRSGVCRSAAAATRSSRRQAGRCRRMPAALRSCQPPAPFGARQPRSKAAATRGGRPTGGCRSAPRPTGRAHRRRRGQQRLGHLHSRSMPSALVNSVWSPIVVDEPLVGLEHVVAGAGLVECELQGQLVQPHAGSPLARRTARAWTGPRGQGQVPGPAPRPPSPPGTCSSAVPARRSDDARALRDPLAGPQVERHPRPPPVVDRPRHRKMRRLGSENGANGSSPRYPMYWPRTTSGSLGLHGARPVEDLVLLLADRLGLQRRRRLHGHEGEDLEQVRDDHVAVGAGGFVEAGATGRGRASRARRSAHGR